MSSVDPAANDPRFVKRWWDSADAIGALTAYFIRNNIPTAAAGMALAPDRTQIADYVDDGDMAIKTPEGWRVIEVKGLQGPKALFSGRHDWPFSHPDTGAPHIFVLAAHTLAAAVERNTLAQVTLSRDYQAIAIIPFSTRDRWYLLDVPIGYKDGKAAPIYACSLEYVRFKSIGPAHPDKLTVEELY